jgi:hypothetical protein
MEGVVKNLVVLIGGKRRSGKSTVAEVFREYGYMLNGFADPLYELHNKIWLEKPRIKSWHRDLTPSERGRLIRLGKALREVHPDALVRMLASRINALWGFPGYSHRLVIPNYRFPNERGIATYLDGETTVRTVRVERLGYEPRDGWDDDPTETALDNEVFDYTIRVEDGDLATLKSEATDLVFIIKEEVNQ